MTEQDCDCPTLAEQEAEALMAAAAMGFRMDDFIITIAYFSIPVQILLSMYRYPRLATMPPHILVLLILFALFIFLCGAGHLLRCLNMTHTVHFQIMNGCTAAISLATALYLVPLVPNLMNELDKSLQELVILNKETEASKRKLMTFMAFLCHEIRNPLFAITSSISYLEDVVHDAYEESADAVGGHDSASLCLPSAIRDDPAPAASNDTKSNAKPVTDLFGKTYYDLHPPSPVSESKSTSVQSDAGHPNGRASGRRLSHTGCSDSLLLPDTRHPDHQHQHHQQQQQQQQPLSIVWSNEQNQALSSITQSANLMLRLVNDVLDISKLESGKLQLEEREFDTCQILHGISSTMTNNADNGNSNVAFEPTIHPSVPRRIVSDSVRILQIVYNLLSNAKKFTTSGTIRFDVSVMDYETALLRRKVCSAKSSSKLALSPDGVPVVSKVDATASNTSNGRSRSSSNNNNPAIDVSSKLSFSDLSKAGKPNDDNIVGDSNHHNNVAHAAHHDHDNTTANTTASSSSTASWSAQCADIEQGGHINAIPAVYTTSTSLMRHIDEQDSNETMRARNYSIGSANNKIVLRLTVQDTGCGIANERLQRIFEPYSQAKLSDYRKYGGTGLGLAIIAKLVKLMRGSIEVTSQVKVGSKFVVYLPVTVPDDSYVPSTVDADESTMLLHEEKPSSNYNVMTRTTQSPEALDRLTSSSSSLFDVSQVVLSPNKESLAQQMSVPNLSMKRKDNSGSDSGNDDATTDTTPLLAMQQEGDVSTAQEPMFESSSSLENTMLPTGAATLRPSAATVRRDPFTTQGTISSSSSPPKKSKFDKFNFPRNQCAVLIVDDNAVNRKILTRMLQHFGLQFEQAINGQDAVSKIKNSRNVTGDDNDVQFGLVFMDLSMPVMDGCEATRRIRTDLELADLPIVALTANALEQGRDEAIQAGANEFVTKPILRPDFYAKCTQYLK